VSNSTAADHTPGLPAGFDPLRLGASDKEQLKWFREGELYNGRWAMAAVAGILFTDLVGLPKFWEAGAQVRERCYQQQRVFRAA
jgi:hypothetical protein